MERGLRSILCEHLEGPGMNDVGGWEGVKVVLSSPGQPFSMPREHQRIWPRYSPGTTAQRALHLESDMNRIMVLALLYTLSVVLGKCLKFSEPRFFHLKNWSRQMMLVPCLYPLSRHVFLCGFSSLRPPQLPRWPG